MTPTGSRRIDELKPRMYSPVALPSSTRAAPAKKRIWSHIGGISSLSVSPFGLPVFSASISTSSLGVLLDRVGDPQQCPCRSLGVVSRQPSSNARSRGAHRRVDVAAPDSGEVA